jgi:hypothetical protein
MPVGAPVRRRMLVVAVLGAVVLLGSACEPLRNAPPGGGETITRTFRLGPFTLGPGGEAMGSPRTGVPRPSGAFGLKAARFDIVDANGTPVSPHDVHLHHIVFTTTAREDRLCPGRAERFLGSGMERTPIDLWGPYTYLVGAGDQWGAIYHVMNETPAGTPAKTVYIQYTLSYQPGANATNSRPVMPLFQDVTGCGGSTYDVPGDGGPGSVHLNRRDWMAPRDGMAIFAGGHLHEGGIDIRLLDSTTDHQLCKGVATYHENPRHLASINGCVIHERVVAGHSYRVAARYDNSAPLQNVMGIMLTYVWWGTQ